MASDIWLQTILIVKKETCCRHIGYSFRLTARVLLYAPSHRQDSTYHSLCYTSHGALAGTRNSSVGSPHEGSIRRPIAPWANTLTPSIQRQNTACLCRTRLMCSQPRLGPHQSIELLHMLVLHSRFSKGTCYSVGWGSVRVNRYGTTGRKNLLREINPMVTTRSALPQRYNLLLLKYIYN